VSVPSSTPSGLWNQNLGAGCGNPGAPLLYGVGTPDRAAIPNATFALRCTGNPAAAPCGFVLSTTTGTVALGGGCTAFTGDLLTLVGPLATTADGTGAATLSLAVPNNPSLEGQDLDFQMLNIAAGGAFLGAINLSNGLRVRIGNLIAGCP